MTSAPKGGGGVSEMLTKPDMGEGGLTNVTSAKKDILLQSNKYKNKNTQLLNLSSNSAILPNMIFYGTKMCIRQVSAD